MQSIISGWLALACMGMLGDNNSDKQNNTVDQNQSSQTIENNSTNK